jgi:hypothetical protein
VQKLGNSRFKVEPCIFHRGLGERFFSNDDNMILALEEIQDFLQLMNLVDKHRSGETTIVPRYAD